MTDAPGTGGPAVGGSVETRIPGATYRLQLGASFTFREARALVPYLAELGITDCYLSPILEPCAPGSHGYDVADHGQISHALGGEPEYRALTDTLRAHGMGVLLDIVPNHMGISRGRNAWWQDVLENGSASPFASFFDIEWEPPKPELKNRILLPILEDHYGRVLERQELRLEYEDGAFRVRYGEAVLPIDPSTYPQILSGRLPDLEAELGSGDPHLRELQRLLATATGLPARTETEPARQAERAREKALLTRRLDALTREAPAMKGLVEEALLLVNGIPGRPESFDRLDALLGAQAYRVAYWGVAGDEINYRRFFDVNDLAAIRMEEPAVFEATHRLLLRLVREGRITGLRIDHPDGLYAPADYLRALGERCARELSGGREGAPSAPALYVVVEKVLGPGEQLPEQWPVHGTTGYELLNALNGLFVDPKGARVLEQTYQRFTGQTAPFADIAHEAKRLITDTTMASELTMLGRRLGRLAERRRESRDFTERTLTEALREIVACFPVYRTYVGDGAQAAGAHDCRHVEEAVATARRRSPAASPSVFEFIEDLLCRTGELDFVRRFQQLTGPAAAKGVEDTAFYRYTRLLSLNEVGGAPDRFGTSDAEFHQLNADRLARWPHALSATSTHDTKRSEDVRARINVLSELPHEWRARVRAWHRLNRRHRTLVDGQPAPGPDEEYLLYQTLLGAWPIEPPNQPIDDAEYAVFLERIQEYMFKALREAKAHVSWVHPNPAYDAAVRRFVGAILDRSVAGASRAGTAPPADRRDRGRARGEPVSRGLPPLPAADRGGGHVQRAVPDAPEARRARSARHVPGHRGVEPQPGRPGQPAPRGLRAAPGGLARDPGGACRIGRPGGLRPLARRRQGGRAGEALSDPPRPRLPAAPGETLPGRCLCPARVPGRAAGARGGVRATTRGRDGPRRRASLPRPAASSGSTARGAGVGRDVARAPRHVDAASLPERADGRSGGGRDAGGAPGARAGDDPRELSGGASRGGGRALNRSCGAGAASS